jgi:Skp family chaperone for outer membrane proteins
MALRPLARTPVRAALAAVALALALPALATTYKWVDAGGRVVYSDQPPTGGQKYEVVGSAAPPDNPNATREMANKDAELRKLQKDRVEDAQKAEKTRADAQKKADVCAQARAAVRTYQSDQPLLTTNDKGERVYLEGSERARRLAEQQRLVREYCAAG